MVEVAGIEIGSVRIPSCYISITYVIYGQETFQHSWQELAERCTCLHTL